MIGQGDDHGVDGFVVEDAPEIPVSHDGFAAFFERLDFAIQVRSGPRRRAR